MWRHRAIGPGYLVRYARLIRLRLLHPDVVTRGMVFLGKGVRVQTLPGYGRLDLGAFVHIGDGSALRAHEGTLRIGDKVVLGSDVRVTCWLDVEIGTATLVADWCYVADFDHVHDDVTRPVKDQGIRKTPVRIGAGSWLGLRSTVLRGSVLGRGTVVAAHSVVRGSFGDHLVLAGSPAVQVADRAERGRLRAQARERGVSVAALLEEIAEERRREAVWRSEHQANRIDEQNQDAQAELREWEGTHRGWARLTSEPTEQ